MDEPVDIPQLAEPQIKTLLQDYAMVSAALAQLARDEEYNKNTLLGPELVAALQALAQQYAQERQPLQEQLEHLASQIRVAVIAHGYTVKGDKFQAVWSKPRVSWDDAALQGYAAVHEEILQFWIEGLPSCSIRKR